MGPVCQRPAGEAFGARPRALLPSGPASKAAGGKRYMETAIERVALRPCRWKLQGLPGVQGQLLHASHSRGPPLARQCLML